jgi:hypothetical protein
MMSEVLPADLDAMCLPPIRIVATTSFSRSGTRVAAFRNVTAVIRYPLDPVELIINLHRFVSTAGREARQSRDSISIKADTLQM